ncbi:MAG TPA: ATP-binding protein [Herpetosiphonaceae bacterium]
MADQHQDPSPDTAPTHTILVVDDDVTMCQFCAQTLRKVGYSVTDTTSGREALAQLQRGQFDLILTDIWMPEISGLELARQAREIDPGLAIVIMTGETTVETLREAVQQGVTSYLSKPFEIDELRLTVAQVLHQRQLLQDNIRLEALVRQLQLSNSFNRTLAVSELCEEVLKAVAKQIGSQDGYFFLMTPDGQPTLLHAGTHRPELDEQGWNFLRRVYEVQQLDQATLTLDGSEHAMIALPLCVGGTPLGSVMFDYAPPLTRPRLESLHLLMWHAGAALNNAQLYTHLHEAHQRLQDLDRLKSEFISITSHELRTPLSIVLGYTILLHDQAASPAREYLQRVLESGQRINDIIDDMINLRRLETRQEELALEEIDLNVLVHGCAAGVQSLARAKQQELTVECEVGAPSGVVIDQPKIEVVLQNLLSNAIKFTPRQGRVRLRAWCEEVQIVPFTAGATSLILSPGTWVFISISDSGIGIPQQQQRRIFERFYQVADSLTREQGGTGLGLALVQGLVQLHGGQVWVESQEGQGSTFTIALPQRGPQAHSA